MVKMELYFLNSAEYEFEGKDGKMVTGKSARFIELNSKSKQGVVYKMNMIESLPQDLVFMDKCLLNVEFSAPDKDGKVKFNIDSFDRILEKSRFFEQAKIK